MNEQQEEAIQHLVNTGVFPNGLLAVGIMKNEQSHIYAWIPASEVKKYDEREQAHPLAVLEDALSSGAVFMEDDDENEWNWFEPEPEPSG